MDTLYALSGVFAAFGLSSAAGLNAYIPLLTIGVLSRLGLITLGDPYALLGSTPALLVLVALGVVDFVADKVPAVDHVTHMVGALVHPVAGAIAFASQSNVITDLHPALSLGAGFVLAGGFHTARAAIRPAATATTAGIGNPVISFIEDVISFVLSILAFVAPLIAFGLFIVLAIMIVRTWRGVRRRLGGIRR
jgi:hypothetical protein